MMVPVQALHCAYKAAAAFCIAAFAFGFVVGRLAP